VNSIDGKAAGLISSLGENFLIHTRGESMEAPDSASLKHVNGSGNHTFHPIFHPQVEILSINTKFRVDSSSFEAKQAARPTLSSVRHSN
tara:strand:- start:1059 stop:1325 length:267 start_codon:yes stop_codon:yes gene_type:complete